MKRSFDFLFGILLLPIFLLSIFVLAILIIITDHYSPFYFKQFRIGKSKKRFRMLKMQAMKPPKCDLEINDKERDKIRATWLGDVMRDHGWDELPQIFNILIGNMSFVGPRPLLEKDFARIRELNPEIIDEVLFWEKERSTVRPGLSGWLQIHSLIPDTIKYDMEYLRDPSLKKHLEIFYKSIIIFIIGKERFFWQK